MIQKVDFLSHIKMTSGIIPIENILTNFPTPLSRVKTPISSFIMCKACQGKIPFRVDCWDAPFPLSYIPTLLLFVWSNFNHLTFTCLPLPFRIIVTILLAPNITVQTLMYDHSQDMWDLSFGNTVTRLRTSPIKMTWAISILCEWGRWNTDSINLKNNGFLFRL